MEANLILSNVLHLEHIPEEDFDCFGIFSVDICACFRKYAKLSVESSSSSPWDPKIVLGREGDRQ